MFRKSEDLKAPRDHNEDRGPRGRIALIGLLLALAIGGGVQAPAAQAAPAAEQVTYQMESTILSLRGEVCIGDVVDIRVFIYRHIPAGMIGQGNQYLPGIRVDAILSTQDVARMNPSNGTRDTSASSDLPGIADYSFQATKAGILTIKFKASITDAWFGYAPGIHALSAFEMFDVVDCQYRVSAVSNFSPGPGAWVGGVIKDAVMTLGSDGFYKGTAIVKWLGYLPPTLCVNVHYLDPATTEVELTGIRDAEGRLHVIIAYDIGTSVWRASCGADFTDAITLNPDELKFDVPGSGEAGIELSHAIDFAAGYTTVTVIQEKSGGQ